jgi:hypothetical protein
MLTPADVQTILDAIRRTPDPRRAPSLDAAGAAWVTWATTIGRPAFDLVQRARAAFPPVALRAIGPIAWTPAPIE